MYCLEFMEHSSFHTDNQIRKTDHFSTDTHISGHNCSNRLHATPYFHFRFGTKCRQMHTVDGETSYDHGAGIIVSVEK